MPNGLISRYRAAYITYPKMTTDLSNLPSLIRQLDKARQAVRDAREPAERLSAADAFLCRLFNLIRLDLRLRVEDLQAKGVIIPPDLLHRVTRNAD